MPSNNAPHTQQVAPVFINFTRNSFMGIKNCTIHNRTVYMAGYGYKISKSTCLTSGAIFCREGMQLMNNKIIFFVVTSFIPSPIKEGEV